MTTKKWFEGWGGGPNEDGSRGLDQAVEVDVLGPTQEGYWLVPALLFSVPGDERLRSAPEDSFHDTREAAVRARHIMAAEYDEAEAAHYDEDIANCEEELSAVIEKLERLRAEKAELLASAASLRAKAAELDAK